MSTYADLKTVIANDLRRSDLTSQIAQAILDAIRDHGTERFWFNETRSHPLSLTSGTTDFSITASATLQEFIKIDWIRVSVGGVYVRMDRDDPDNIEELQNVTNSGEPHWWTYYGDGIRVYPTPNITYSALVAGHYRLVPLSADTDTNAWTNAAKDLIRYSALKRVLASPVRNLEAAKQAEGLELAQLAYLRRETDRRQRRGRMAPYYG